jgi:hypothetical protein
MCISNNAAQPTYVGFPAAYHSGRGMPAPLPLPGQSPRIATPPPVPQFNIAPLEYSDTPSPATEELFRKARAIVANAGQGELPEPLPVPDGFTVATTSHETSDNPFSPHYRGGLPAPLPLPGTKPNK